MVQEQIEALEENPHDIEKSKDELEAEKQLDEYQLQGEWPFQQLYNDLPSTVVNY